MTMTNVNRNNVMPSSCKLITTTLIISLLTLLIIQTPPPTHAKLDRNAPHTHRGTISPYKPGPFLTLSSLSSSDETTLRDGKSVTKQIPDESNNSGSSGGKAICIQDVDCERAAVWNQILNFDDYVGKVNKLKECKNYVSRKNEDGTHTIKTKMVVGVLPGYSYEYYCDHTYHPEESSLTWSLDYDKTSDFDDVAGHWHLEDHPTKKKCTRVFYACDIKFKKAVPGPIMNFLTKSALRQATSWVKRESEASPSSVIPAEYATATESQ